MRTSATFLSVTEKSAFYENSTDQHTQANKMEAKDEGKKKEEKGKEKIKVGTF